MIIIVCHDINNCLWHCNVFVQNLSGFERAVLVTEDENNAVNAAAIQNEKVESEVVPKEGYNEVATGDVV